MAPPIDVEAHSGRNLIHLEPCGVDQSSREESFRLPVRVRNVDDVPTGFFPYNTLDAHLLDKCDPVHAGLGNEIPDQLSTVDNTRCRH